MIPPDNATSAYATLLPIAVGDSIGVDLCVDLFSPRFIVSSPGSARERWLPLLADGGPGRASDPVTAQEELAVNAEIEPTSSFSAGTKSKKRGKLEVTATLPNAGTLVAGDVNDATVAAAAGKTKAKAKLRHATAQIAAAGPATLLIKPTKSARRSLAQKGSLKTKLKLVFTPTGGGPSVQVLKVKLKKR